MSGRLDLEIYFTDVLDSVLSSLSQLLQTAESYVADIACFLVLHLHCRSEPERHVLVT